MSTISSLTSASIQNPDAPSIKNIEDAAQQFEGLLLHELLKSTANADGGWLGTGEEDSAGMQALDMAQQQFAAALAANGGLGLAKIVISQLTASQKSHE